MGRVERDAQAAPYQAKCPAGTEREQQRGPSDQHDRPDAADRLQDAVNAQYAGLDAAIDGRHVVALGRALGLQRESSGRQRIEPRTHGLSLSVATSRRNSERVASSRRGFSCSRLRKASPANTDNARNAAVTQTAAVIRCVSQK